MDVLSNYPPPHSFFQIPPTVPAPPPDENIQTDFLYEIIKIISFFFEDPNFCQLFPDFFFFKITIHFFSNLPPLTKKI